MFLLVTLGTAAFLIAFILISRIFGRKVPLLPYRLALIILVSLICGWIFWLIRPAVGFRFPALWIWTGIILVTGALFCTRDENDYGLFIPFGVFLLALLVFSVYSGKMTQAGRYRDLLAGHITQTEAIDFTKDIAPIDLNNLRVVDQKLARQRGATLIESIAGLGSQVELGTMNIQNLNGEFDIITGAGASRRLKFDNELVWAGVLYPSGPFREKTTPGYVIVSALDAGRAFFVTAVGGEKLAVKYSTGHYFGNNLVRHLRSNGYLTRGIADYTFELSDQGKPYYAVTLFQKQIGWNAPEAVGVVTVDVQSGEIKEYTIDDAPAFVDRIQPEAFIEKQLNYYGRFVHGWLNSWLKKKDVQSKTAGTSLVYSDGQAYFYSGMQSAGSDRGTSGFVLVNTRTKETRLYRISGITEDRAGEALENAKGVKEAGYTSTPAILYNIGGRAVYFATLKGSDGLVKMYGFISISNEQILGVGTSVREALRAFETALINAGDPLSLDSVVQETAVEAVVSAVARETLSGMTYYYLMLEGYAGMEFLGSSDTFKELKWTRPGDKVEIVYPQGSRETVTIRAFNNKAVDLIP